MKRGNSADWKASVCIIFQFRLQTLFMNESMRSIDCKSSSALFHPKKEFALPGSTVWLEAICTCRVGEAINNNCENSIIKNYGARWAQSTADEIERASCCGFGAGIYFIMKPITGMGPSGVNRRVKHVVRAETHSFSVRITFDKNMLPSVWGAQHSTLPY